MAKEKLCCRVIVVMGLAAPLDVWKTVLDFGLKVVRAHPLYRSVRQQVGMSPLSLPDLDVRCTVLTD